MGMDTYIRGFTSDQDPKYRKMKAIVDACKMANVSCPEEVEAYFNERGGDSSNPESALETKLITTEWDGDSASGIELNVADIPKGVTKIQFYNSW